MIHAHENMYKNKYAVNAAIGLVECLTDLEKNKESEIAKAKEELVKWQESADYKSLQTEQKKRRENDDYEFNIDPHGHETYLQSVSNNKSH